MRSADRNEASQTTNTPSGKRADDSAATANATAVLPTPPGPVTVVNANDATLLATSAISRSRPTSGRERTGASWRTSVIPIAIAPAHVGSLPTGCDFGNQRVGRDATRPGSWPGLVLTIDR